MTTRTKITILIAIVILLIDAALGVYIIYGTKKSNTVINNQTTSTSNKTESNAKESTTPDYKIINIDSDEKMLSAAQESLKFIDKFHTEKGYFPCNDEFYINFWNRHYTYEPDLNGPSYNSPLIYYYPYPECDNGNDRPQKFLWFYYSLKKPNPKAFGTPSPNSVGTEYRVGSKPDDPGQEYYKDALKQF